MMLKRWMRAGIGALMLAGGASVHAAPVAADGFETYAPGTLSGANGGSGFAAGWSVNGGLSAGQSVVDTSTVGGALSYSVTNSSAATVGTIDGATRAVQFSSSSSNGSTLVATRGFSSAQTGDEVWARALVRWQTGAVDGSDFITLYYGTTNTAPNFGITGNNLTDFHLREGGTAFGATGPDIAPGNVGSTTYLLVTRLFKSVSGGPNYDRFTLWVNPVLDGFNQLPAPAVVGNLSNAFSSVGGLGIRLNNIDSAQSETVLFDEVAFGTTAGDVVPGATGVPEPGSIALLAVGAGAALLRCRRV